MPVSQTRIIVDLGPRAPVDAIASLLSDIALLGDCGFRLDLEMSKLAAERQLFGFAGQGQLFSLLADRLMGDRPSGFLIDELDEIFYRGRQSGYALSALPWFERLNGLVRSGPGFAPSPLRIKSLHYENPIDLAALAVIGDAIPQLVTSLGAIGGFGWVIRTIAGRGPVERAQADRERANAQVARAVARRIDEGTLRQQLQEDEPALDPDALGFTKDELAAMQRLSDLGFEFETSIDDDEAADG